MNSIVRVSILRCAPDRFSEMRQMMLNAEKVLRPGIESMRGLLAYYGGAEVYGPIWLQRNKWTRSNRCWTWVKSSPPKELRSSDR